MVFLCLFVIGRRWFLVFLGGGFFIVWVMSFIFIRLGVFVGVCIVRREVGGLFGVF